MSQSEIHRFVTDLQSHAALKAEIEALQPDKSRAMSMAALVSVAASKGYSFTADELTAFTTKADGSLTDADLDGVVGGFALPSLDRERIRSYLDGIYVVEKVKSPESSG